MKEIVCSVLTAKKQQNSMTFWEFFLNEENYIIFQTIWLAATEQAASWMSVIFLKLLTLTAAGELPKCSSCIILLFLHNEYIFSSTYFLHLRSVLSNKSHINYGISSYCCKNSVEYYIFFFNAFSCILQQIQGS